MHLRGIMKASHKAAGTTQDCESMCLQTIHYCLETGGTHVEAAHLQLLQDCADICASTAKFAARGSSNEDTIAALCAEICEMCAESCDKFAGDAQMKACANQCLVCAAACHALEQAVIGAESSMGARARTRRAEHHPH